MKKILKLTLIMALLLVGVMSCDDQPEPVVYNGIESENRTFLSFPSTSYNLPVRVDSEGELIITLNSSTMSSSERAFSIVVVDSVTTSDSANYSLPSSVTIPAGKYQADIVITGIDNSLQQGETLSLGFSLSGTDNVDMDSNLVLVSIFEVCPVPSDFFTGMYLIEQVTPLIDGPTLSDGDIVEVEVDTDDATGLSRKFLTQNYPAYCGSYDYFFVGLNCNKIIIPNQNNICFCGSGANWFGTPSTTSNYDVSLGDSEIFISFLDDVQGDCGSVATTTYKFTKQ